MILEPGTFTVSGLRKAIPDWVKIVCAIRAYEMLFLHSPQQIRDQLGDMTVIEWVRSLRFDHRPPLQDRPYDTEAKDFIPPQNDPDHIEAISDKAHDQRTFGRKADAEVTVTTRGSDVGEAARIRKIKDTEAIHQAQMLSKSGDYKAAAEVLGAVKQKSRLRPRRKIPSRPFPTRSKSDEKRMSRRHRQ